MFVVFPQPEFSSKGVVLVFWNCAKEKISEVLSLWRRNIRLLVRQNIFS